jgi:tRNA (guanine-N7-)-methyltransferase
LRTFHPRQRGLSPRRADRFRALLTEHGMQTAGPVLDLAEVFGAAAEVWLDIGCGGGEAAIAMAGTHPHQSMVVAEVHTPGVAAVLDAVDANAWRHVRVVHGDALEFIHRVPEGALAGVRVWFPDPWPKPRQRKRRLVRPDVMAALVDRLRVRGALHLATDVADYAAQMRAVCEAEGRLDGGVVPRPAWRPITKYERRGAAEGRDAMDLVYTRVR